MNKNVFFLDFETTGLNPYHDEIIEVAIKKKDENIIYKDLVKPNKTRIIPWKVKEITGITEKDVFSEKSIYSMNACENIFNFLKGNYNGEGYIYLIAHNGILFDFVLLKTLMKTYAYNLNKKIFDIEIFSIYPKIKFIDTLDVSRRMMVGLNSYSQKYLCNLFKLEQKNAHRAFGDVEDLNYIYNRVVKYGINLFNLDKDLMNNIDKLYDFIYKL